MWEAHQRAKYEKLHKSCAQRTCIYMYTVHKFLEKWKQVGEAIWYIVSGMVVISCAAGWSRSSCLCWTNSNDISSKVMSYTVADLEGASLPLSPKIYHILIVKFKIWDPKYRIYLYNFAPPPLFGVLPSLSKFLDSPLTYKIN
jgi:hypothetical protein